ncbi:hypothetical protein M2451_000952 [Dysgonomonas sp. PFB1-18]|uniref:hypothetical protein n=1 Tax=unclassified Dysgonomonas TaxID=2630389 RepID=UPI002475B1D8|nr:MULTISPECIES: hypothetical protein [unclassified Dysgonomonas]MDH6308641.1 hypothetical protein [Dysgonomonas sp. PF1-14]MDH6338142.1 hypothetical protein [Dysgonomonas sp. PF1-16]MDH6379639.1 hypothetical protein [Dysgonomonas sp. PFB1-18]MDH6396969.1 hypothetical protein [Dysgonomonas sp. PF1-23]
MKKIVYIILSFFFITCCFSCSNDDDNISDDYTRIELKSSLKCTTEYEKKETAEKRKATVILYEDKDYNGYLIYLKDENNQYYHACTLPEEYQKNGLDIIFSGTVYYPDPRVDKLDPLLGWELDITELWVKM